MISKNIIFVGAQDAVILCLLPLIIDVGRPDGRKKKDTQNPAESSAQQNDTNVAQSNVTKTVITRGKRLETFVQHVEVYF